MSVLYAVESHFYLKQWNKQNTQCQCVGLGNLNLAKHLEF